MYLEERDAVNMRIKLSMGIHLWVQFPFKDVAHEFFQVFKT